MLQITFVRGGSLKHLRVITGSPIRLNRKCRADTESQVPDSLKNLSTVAFNDNSCLIIIIWRWQLKRLVIIYDSCYHFVKNPDLLNNGALLILPVANTPAVCHWLPVGKIARHFGRFKCVVKKSTCARLRFKMIHGLYWRTCRLCTQVIGIRFLTQFFAPCKKWFASLS